jgi:hypothetical protein
MRCSESPASTSALLWDGTGRLLILKPTYELRWTVPGRIVEVNADTPWQARQHARPSVCQVVAAVGNPVSSEDVWP